MTAQAIPILRVSDYDPAIEFYVKWLGFKIDWKEGDEEGPFRIQLSMKDIILQLVQYTPSKSQMGSWVLVQDFKNLIPYRKILSLKSKKFSVPPIKQQPGETRKILSIVLTDPFGNSIEIREVLGKKSS